MGSYTSKQGLPYADVAMDFQLCYATVVAALGDKLCPGLGLVCTRPTTEIRTIM